MTFLTLAETSEFLKAEAAVYTHLETLIKHSIAVKRVSFSKTDFADEYACLHKLGFTARESDQFFALDYGMLPVSFVAAETAAKIIGEKVPDTVIGCLNFAARFCERIRQPAPRTIWYGDFEIQFESYLLIYLHQNHNIDITGFLENITEEMLADNPDVRGVDISYRHVFAFLNDEIEKSFAAIVKMLSAPRTRDAGLDALRDIGTVNPVKAEKLYTFSQLHNGYQYDGLLPNLIIGLYSNNKTYFLQQAMDLMKTDPVQSLLAITWIQYTESEQITQAFGFIAKQQIIDIEYLRNVSTFYIRLIENPATPGDIKQQCFKLIEELANNEDDHLRHNLIWRTGLIKGHDREKYDLLHVFMAWGKPDIIRDYFNNFSSPRYLFDLIKQSFVYHGMHVDMQLLKDPLHSQYMLNRQAFQTELATLLVDDLAIIRFAGVQVMMSAHGGIYQADFSGLNEEQQIRAIDSLLLMPVNIEDILPFVLTLRTSQYEAVKAKLTAALTDLIGAYEHSVIDMASNSLDVSIEADRQLLETLKGAYTLYEQELSAKRQIKEFDPLENELPAIEMFFRLEQEKQAEMMEKAQSNSFFAQIAKTINVIRGSGYTTEGCPEIVPLEKFGMSRLIDRRYYINPDKFEWNIKMNAIAKNYKPPLAQ